jgi:hypothetical protein
MCSILASNAARRPFRATWSGGRWSRSCTRESRGPRAARPRAGTGPPPRPPPAPRSHTRVPRLPPSAYIGLQWDIGRHRERGRPGRGFFGFPAARALACSLVSRLLRTTGSAPYNRTPASNTLAPAVPPQPIPSHHYKGQRWAAVDGGKLSTSCSMRAAVSVTSTVACRGDTGQPPDQTRVLPAGWDYTSTGVKPP